MPLRLVQERRYSWPVHVHMPVEGKWETREFTGYFTALTLEEINANAYGEVNTDDLIRTHMVGWEGVTDENGEPVPFTPEALEMAIADPIIYAGIADALKESSDGRAETKNSRTPLAP